MKKLLLGAVALTMLATACKKSDDGGSGTSNAITINGTSYSTTTTGGSILVSNNIVQAGGINGTNAASIIMEFPGSTTPAAGDYTVVADSSSTLGANTMSFTAGSTASGTAAAYRSTGAGTIKATVTVSNGKITVNMPEAPAKQSNGTATVNVGANITQP